MVKDPRWIKIDQKTWCGFCKQYIPKGSRALYLHKIHRVYCEKCGQREHGEEIEEENIHVCGFCRRSVKIIKQSYLRCHKRGDKSQKVVFDQPACENFAPKETSVQGEQVGSKGGKDE